MDGVILGMPGPWAESNYEEADIYTTKIGGIPDFPIPLFDEKPDLLKCDTCRSNLSLVAQVYAPVSSASLTIDERLIFVFFCMVPRCESPIWKALRVQKMLSNKGDESPKSSSCCSKTNWLDDLCSFDVGGEDDDIDIEELSRELSEAASLNSTDKNQNNVAKSRKEYMSTGQSTRSIDSSIPVLPCFYTYAQEEKLSKKAISESSKLQISIEEYEKIRKDDSDGETYGEEKYEYDTALNADRTYLKFMKRMDAYPEQCFRYSYAGKPLLASGEIGNPGSCKLCGGARHFEMQLMPTLISFLLERSDDQQRIPLEKFDWLTVFVYTCSTNCAGAEFQVKSGDDEWIVAEEALIFQQE
ncbi:programmed cell death protein 2-like [Salvia splendens]|nr:programmed cell death protein 2-like [Salvia splendens]